MNAAPQSINSVTNNATTGGQPQRRRLIIDTDPGIDDSLALLMAMQCERDGMVELAAVTVTHGNVCVDLATRNAKAVVALHHLWYGTPHVVPVFEGCGAPLDASKTNPFARHVHGSSGLADLPAEQLDELVRLYDSHLEQQQQQQREQDQGRENVIEVEIDPSLPAAVQQLVREAARHDPSDTSTLLEVVAVGPLSNVALAFQRYPDVMQRLSHVYIMGGAMWGSAGNITMLAEFNVYADPLAWKIVVEQALVPVTVVPLDVTTTVSVTPELLGRYKAAARTRAELPRGVPLDIYQFIFHIIEFVFARPWNQGKMHMHDPSAIVLLFHPELGVGERRRIHVETQVGTPTEGLTYVERRLSQIEAALQEEPLVLAYQHVQQEAVLQWCLDRLFPRGWNGAE